MRKTLLLFFMCMMSASFYAQVDVTATSGTAAATYTTLKGAFDAINAGTHQGAISLSITANTTETATAVLNASGGTSSFTSVLIKPATGVTATISGSIASAPLVRIFASNVTFDGSNTVSGTTRDLTVTNTATTAPQVIAFNANTLATVITNVVVKNLNIVNGINTSSALVFVDMNTTAVGGYFNNVTIQNNAIKKAYIGLYMFAATAAGNGGNTLVTGNDLSASGTDAIRLVGIYLQGVDGGTVSNNTIGNFETTNAEIKRGVWFATATVNSSIVSNTITNLGYSGTGAGGASGITVTSGNTGASAIANIMVDNNTISTFTSSGTGSLFAGIYLGGTLTNGVTFKRNRINGIRNTNTGGYGAAGIQLASTSTTTNALVYNNIVYGVSGYGYAAGGGVNDNGNGIIVSAGAGYKIYYNTVVMNVNQNVAGRPSAFNVTSGVTTAGAIDLRNNIFVNTQTQTGDRYAIYSGAANTVFSNINYNDYYTTGTNLGYIGAANQAALANVQTAFGGNANSINVLPVFVSASDFHLDPTTNLSFDNTATPLAEVTVDADNIARNATTPDLGAYEFASNLGTEEFAKAKVKMYPNPVMDILSFDHVTTIESITVYTLQGQKIVQQRVNAMNGSVDMRNMQSGIYLVKIATENGTETATVIKK